MKRYYLIRRKLENFLGPMPLDEVRSAYQKLEFGGQDEVCGHCGKWVVIEDAPRLRQHYPEVSDALQNPTVGGWSVSGHEGSRKVRKESRSSPKKSPKNLYMGLVVFCGILAGAGAFFMRNGDLPAKFLADNLPLPSHAQSLLDDQQLDAFRTYMYKHLDSVSAKASKSKNSYAEWIPYLRALAYMEGGEVSGIRAKLIQGPGKYSAPSDCSVEAWRRKWADSVADNDGFVNGTLSSKKPSLRILLWDPHWIKRRSFEGWVRPANYYAFCLEMAKKGWDAWRSSDQTVNPATAEAIERRLLTQIAVVNSINVPMMGSGFDVLRSLSCMDQRREDDPTQNCRPNFTGMHPDWNGFLDAYDSYANVRLMTEQNDQLSEEQLTKFEILAKALPATSPLSGLDYQPEIRFAKLVMLNLGRVNDAATKVRNEFNELNFTNH